MHLRPIATFFLTILFIAAPLFSQTSILKGRFLDSETKSSLVGVTVKLTNSADTSDRQFKLTDMQGRFRFTGLTRRPYILEATYIGYPKLKRTIRIEKDSLDVGNIRMRQDTVMMDEMVVEAVAPRTVVKGDTTEYNAEAFKVNKDATSEDLVAKMPGVTVEQGQVKAQGETVQKVKMDGRDFMGGDPTLALRNLPADAVDKIQVYDDMSEQSRFTGFDDGNRTKTMNIVTRANRRNSSFGKLYAGYGTEDRYSAGATFNRFDGDQRVTLLGMSNNVNQQNFSIQDILGVMGGSNLQRMAGPLLSGGGAQLAFRIGQRMGFGGGPGGGGGFRGFGGIGNFFVGQQGGLTRTNSIGMNYSDRPVEGLEMNGSYFFNLMGNTNGQTLDREYIQSGQTSTLYNETSSTANTNGNHRFNLRVEYDADTSNAIIFIPNFSVQNNNSTSATLGATSLPTGTQLNSTNNRSETQRYGYQMSSELMLRHRFDTPGRTISVSIQPGLNRRAGWSNQLSLSEYMAGTGVTQDSIDQHGDLLTEGNSLSGRLVYTEPLGESGQLQVNYYGTRSFTSSDSRRNNFDPATQAYTSLDTLLTNTYDNTYITHSGGVGYRVRNRDLNGMVGVSYQVSDLTGNQTFPFTSDVSRKFYNVLPSANLQWRFASSGNLRMFYNTSTQSPSITQLQSVVDNSNPLQLTTGNPNLKQTLSHFLVANYMNASFAEGKSMFIVFNVSATQDYIGNSIVTAARDTVVDRGIRLASGTQLTIPQNLGNQWNYRGFFTYSFPFTLIKSTLNFSTGVTYSITPGLINGVKNTADVTSANGGFVLSSNISPEVDFTISYNGSYNISRNSIQSADNQKYYTHTAGLRSTITFWEGIVWTNDIANTLYSGLGPDYDKSYYLWNMGLAKKFLENDRGEIKVSVYDLLKQNQAINRTVNELYLENSRSQVLDRHFLLTVSYTLR